MRAISILFYGLAGVVALAGLGMNLYLQSLACAFGSTSGNCRFRWPWEMGGEDLILLVLGPMAAVAILLALGWAFGRR